MKYVFGGRRSGKTICCIKESHKTGRRIVVANTTMVKLVKQQAEQMGLPIPEPVSYRQLKNNADEMKAKAFTETKFLQKYVRDIENTIKENFTFTISKRGEETPLQWTEDLKVELLEVEE